MLLCPCITSRVVQNRIYTPYMTVYLVISLPKLPYVHRIYMVLANPNYFIIVLPFLLYPSLHLYQGFHYTHCHSTFVHSGKAHRPLILFFART